MGSYDVLWRVFSKKVPVEEEDDDACVVEILPAGGSVFLGWPEGP